MRLILSLRFFIAYFFCVHIASGSDLYWLCGPDEDGCHEDSYAYCACIPHNDQYANQPYCLDFDTLSCEPLIQKSHCDRHFIFENQVTCLATIYHSMPNIPCTLTTYDFCKNHGSTFCNETGEPGTCKHSS